MGHWRRGGGLSATAVRVGLVVAVLAVPLAGVSPSFGQTADAPGDPSMKALLARGIAHSAGSEMRAGLDELRAAVRREPGHTLARRSLAIALLRMGQFGEAEAEFAAILGERRALELSSGRLSAADLPDSTDTDVLLGLATSVQIQGRAREAERLYRTYAGLVGPMSRDAGRAYFRLHELATDTGAEWLDADAELAKALAVDPDIRSATLLPAFTDPRTHPELEPYLRPIELSVSRADTTLEYDTLPLLSRWVAPADTSETLLSLAEGKLQLEILVGADGSPNEVVPVTPVAEEDLMPLTSAVGAWWFTPARAAGENAPAWILFGEAAEAEATDGETDDGEAGGEEAAEGEAGDPIAGEQRSAGPWDDKAPDAP
jgi:tetratricopeptide (TPR) repeat protein